MDFNVNENIRLHGLSARLLTCVAFALWIPLSGCVGWSTAPLTLEGCERVYVPYFKNDTFYRRLEHDLTREVIRRIQEKPGIHLADERSADVIIEGRITEYRLSILSEDRQDVTLEGAATIDVEIKIVRASDQKVLRQATLRDAAEYHRLLNETVDTTRSESFVTLSRRIVDLLERGF
jgi:hypothetical protein